MCGEEGISEPRGASTSLLGWGTLTKRRNMKETLMTAEDTKKIVDGKVATVLT